MRIIDTSNVAAYLFTSLVSRANQVVLSHLDVETGTGAQPRPVGTFRRSVSESGQGFCVVLASDANEEAQLIGVMGMIQGKSCCREPVNPTMPIEVME